MRALVLGQLDLVVGEEPVRVRDREREIRVVEQWSHMNGVVAAREQRVAAAGQADQAGGELDQRLLRRPRGCRSG